MVIAQFFQLIQNRDRVDGLGKVEHRVDGFVNFPVLLEVKILRLQNTDDIRHTLAVDEDGAENGLLRLQRLGLLAGDQFFIHSFLLCFLSLGISPLRS